MVIDKRWMLFEAKKSPVRLGGGVSVVDGA